MSLTLHTCLHDGIGQGSFSSVYLATSPTAVPGHIVAVKCYSRSRCANDLSNVISALRERWAMETLSLLPHPFLVQFEFAHSLADSVVIGMQNIGGGDLFCLLQRVTTLPAERAQCYAAEIALALGHVHSFDIIHRDLRVRARMPRRHHARWSCCSCCCCSWHIMPVLSKADARRPL